MQKLQNFSFTLFLFLFGFFCGNLLPGGSIEFPWNSAQLLGTEVQSSTNTLSSGTEAGNILVDDLTFKNSPNHVEFSPKATRDLFTLGQRSTPQLHSFFSAIPGPGFLGLIVLLLAECINWCGWVGRGKVQPPISKKEANLLQGTPPRYGQIGWSLRFWKNGFQSRFSLQNPFKFSYLNSLKIGFLLGIFVDAFKVGS